jgi:branched-chain amino acid aminotransferase
MYDFLVTHNRKLFKLSKHIDRLFKSAEIIGLGIPWSKDQVSSWVVGTVNNNDKSFEKTVSIYISGGTGFYMNQGQKPTIVIIINKKIPLPSTQYENGIRARAVKYKRPYPKARTTFYVEGVKQLAIYKNKGINEILFYDDLQVFEGAGTNIFAVINNQLITPKSHILQGITRNTLLDILQLNIPIKTQKFHI